MVDILIRTDCNTHSIIIDEVVVAFTTKYDEVEELLEEVCEELEIDIETANIWE